jgi:hypothetical protein
MPPQNPLNSVIYQFGAETSHATKLNNSAYKEQHNRKNGHRRALILR